MTDEHDVRPEPYEDNDPGPWNEPVTLDLIMDMTAETNDLVRRIVVAIEEATGKKIRDEYYAPSLCADCGMCTSPYDSFGEAIPGAWEHYMVHDHVWAEAGMDKGHLCIGCLETRLGRELASEDFSRSRGQPLVPPRLIPLVSPSARAKGEG
jgi:hypothetical protein